MRKKLRTEIENKLYLVKRKRNFPTPTPQESRKNEMKPEMFSLFHWPNSRKVNTGIAMHLHVYTGMYM